jgi:hypothetical protein
MLLGFTVTAVDATEPSPPAAAGAVKTTRTA